MADEPISLLSNSFSAWAGNQVEVLDVNDATMAPAGTNKRATIPVLAANNPFIASGGSHAAGFVPDPGVSAGTTHFLREDATWAVPAGGGMTNPMTTAGDEIIGGAAGVPARLAIGTNGQVQMVVAGAPAWATPPVQTQVSASIPSGNSYTLPASMGNLSTDVSLTLPTAGTYLVWGSVRGFITVSSATQGQYVFEAAQLYDSTNSAAVPNSQVLIFLTGIQATIGTNVVFEQTGAIAPIPYTVTGSTVIHIQGVYGGNATTIVAGSAFTSDAQGATYMFAMRIY